MPFLQPALGTINIKSKYKHYGLQNLQLHHEVYSFSVDIAFSILRLEK